MSADQTMKYIKKYSGGWAVDIRRANKTYVRRFPSKTYGGRDEALKEAIRDRDRAHIEMFGLPVTRRPLHVSKRKGAETSFKGLVLPNGLNVQRVKSEPMYFVVKEFTPTDKKVRFSIKTLGLIDAYKQAVRLLDLRVDRLYRENNWPDDVDPYLERSEGEEE